MTKPLEGILVVALEQALAAPYATCRMADAGARVIKIERAVGDFARGYDTAVFGEASYFVWVNRGKESLVLNLKDEDDAALLRRIVDKADVFVQNFAPGATERLNFGSDVLREQFPRLITCDISGYGDGAYRDMKAYDFLVQSESGLVSISGAEGGGAAAGRSRRFGALVIFSRRFGRGAAAGAFSPAAQPLLKNGAASAIRPKHSVALADV